ncbi:MAG: hypothetical protein ACHQ9S_18065 [Candidatus Binatia bacterium]
MNNRSRLVCAFTIAVAAWLLPASRASAAGWTNARYLYRYVFWGFVI